MYIPLPSALSFADIYRSRDMVVWSSSYRITPVPYPVLRSFIAFLQVKISAGGPIALAENVFHRLMTHWHTRDVANPHLCRFLPVLPTFALARFRVTQSFLSRSVPLGSSSTGSWTAQLMWLSHSFHLLRRLLVVWLGSRLSVAMKLFLDFNLPLGCYDNIIAGSPVW